MWANVDDQIAFLLSEAADFEAGRRSWWNKYADLCGPDPAPEVRAAVMARCAEEDAAEVAKRAYLIMAIRAAAPAERGQ